MHNWMLTFWRGGHNWLCKSGGHGTIYSAVVTCVREKWYRTIKYRFYCRLLYSRPVVLKKVSATYGIVIPTSTTDCISQKSFGISRVKTSFLCYLLGAQCVFNQPCSCLPLADAPASIATSWLITSSVWQWRGGKYRPYHRTQYSDAIMSTMASQITSLRVVYSIVYSDADQRKHQSSASLAFVRGIHRWPVNSPHKGPVTRKMFPIDNGIMGSCELWFNVEKNKDNFLYLFETLRNIITKCVSLDIIFNW